MRQGLFPEDVFTMEHDIYSLGVCLLELGLWSSFVLVEGNAVTPCGELEISHALADNDPRRRGFAVKDKLVQLSKERLPSLVGDRYSEIVRACLCCLDKTDENSFQPSELRDDDEIIVGVRYIENVSLRLVDGTRLTVIDTLEDRRALRLNGQIMEGHLGILSFGKT
jgi:hypothetical protein